MTTNQLQEYTVLVGAWDLEIARPAPALHPALAQDGEL
jgi:hypothetical protein